MIKMDVSVVFTILVCSTLLGHVSGHMGLDPPEAEAGESVIVSLRISHDCGDDTVGTTNFTIELPRYLPSVSVEQMAQWRTFITKVNGTTEDRDRYLHSLMMSSTSNGTDEENQHHGATTATPTPSSEAAGNKTYENPKPESDDSTEIVEYISSITYIGFLPDHFYQLFNLYVKMPDTPGAVLWFKGYQDCHNQGTSIAWAAIPSAEDPDPRYPATSITLVSSGDNSSAH